MTACERARNIETPVASKIRAADYRVKVVDAFGGTHKVFYKHGTALRPTACVWQLVLAHPWQLTLAHPLVS